MTNNNNSRVERRKVERKEKASKRINMLLAIINISTRAIELGVNIAELIQSLSF